MAIRQPDSEPFNYLEGFGDSQVVLVPIHENRIGEESYEQMLREASHFADTYDKILVGVLEAYCTYSGHPILGNIPVLPIGEAGSGTVPRPLTVYDSREEGWRAVARGLAELLESYRPFWQQGIQGSVFFDKERKAWCFDKGRRDGVSIWHREVQVQSASSTISIGIGQVLRDITVLKPLAGFEPGPEPFPASIPVQAQRYLNILVEDHADNQALIKELQEDAGLQQHGIRWTNELAGLDYVLHFHQNQCYLVRPYEDTSGSVEENALNPYRPLTKPIELSVGSGVIKEVLLQVADWEFFRHLEAPYNNQLQEDALEITVFHSQGANWERLGPEGEWVSVPLWAKPFKGGVSYENTIRIQLANRSEQPLYVSAFLLGNYFGSEAGLTEEEQFELKPGEQILLFQRGEGRIPVELASRTLAYNVPYETLEVKFLASNQPFSTNGYWMKAFPGPPGSGFREEEGYFMEKAMDLGAVKPLEGVFIAPLLRIRLDNPAYNRPNAARLEELLLQRPDAEPFIRSLYFESFHLAPRYHLKNKMELQEDESPGSNLAPSLPENYVYTPNGLGLLEYQLQQLPSQLQGKASKPILVALGDSWFNQAEPVDIPHFLIEDFIVIHAPLQGWMELEEMVRRLEKMIEGVPSITLLLSPRGERVLDRLDLLVKEEAPDNTDNIRDILSDDFFFLLDEMAEDWEKRLAFLSSFESRLQVGVHGHDYFAFEEFGGTAFYQRPKEWRRNLAAFVTDLLNARLRMVLDRIGAANIHYLDLRKTLEPQDWTATLIPADTGFRKLAGAVSLFIDQQYQWKEEPYPGTAYFLWQMALMDNTIEAHQALIDAYPEGGHRAWAEERLKALESQSFSQVQSQSQTVGQEETRQEPDALQSLRRRANQLISSNQLADVFQLLDRELRRDAEPRERLAVYRKELTQLERQRRRNKRPSKQLDRDMASLADAVGELVEGVAEGDLKPPPTPPKEGSSAKVEPQQVSRSEQPNTEHRTTGSFTDPRDGRTYRTVELNGLRWMAENLNYDVGEGCWFYDNDPKNGEKYGRLYTWEAAQRTCPPGWRLPTDEEWEALRDSLGGDKESFDALIEGGESGFEVPLEGHHRYSAFWTSEESSPDRAIFWGFYFPDKLLYRNHDNKSKGFSCRCVREIGETQEVFPEIEAEAPNEPLAEQVEMSEAAEEPDSASQAAESTAQESTNQPINQSPKTGTYTDPRDGGTYRTVELNGLRWMAENLNYDARGGWFFENDPKTGEQYGRFYDWDTARGAAPDGWRLPTDEEWAALRDSLGGARKAFAALLETGEGQFNARLVNGFANFWSATERGSDAAWCYSLSRKNGELRRVEMKKTSGLSCRFVQEIENAPNDQEAIKVPTVGQSETFTSQKEAFVKIRESQSGAAARFFVLHGQEGSRVKECALALSTEFLKDAVVFEQSLEDIKPDTDVEQYWKSLITRFAKEKGLKIAGRNLGLGSLINQVVDLIQGQPANTFVFLLSVHHRFWNEGIPALIQQQLDNQQKASEGLLSRLTRRSVEMDFVFMLTYDDKTAGPMLQAFEGLLPGCILPGLKPPITP